MPRLFLLEGEFDLAIRDAEASWVRALLGELESGAFPDLEIWRANLAELAARHGAPYEREGERS